MNFYSVNDGERVKISKWLAFLESVSLLPEIPEWDSIASRFGYACNFTAPITQNEDAPYLTFSQVNAFNEALTDIIAARAYARYRKMEGKERKNYVF